jgi:hypothetical protein
MMSGILVSGCRAAGSSAIAEARADEPARAEGGGDRTVVVELFTSEGCSSCPPADAVLAALGTDPRVYALSFHVDYWDELGWPDPFASHDNTARQRAYSSAFGVRGLYTPQMVVGGIDGFSGSDRSQAQADIDTALSKPTQVALSLKASSTGDGWIGVESHATGAPVTAEVNFALVQRSATSRVRAGENSGRTLRHVDIVRAFATAGASGTARLKVPAGLRQEDAEIVGFVQLPGGSATGMPILGAARTAIGP